MVKDIPADFYLEEDGTHSNCLVWENLEHFIEQQKAKYICPKCGGIISIHDKECSECQEKIK